MPSSIINSDDGVISGTSGLKSSGGDDGVLQLQNNGTTAVTVNASGNVGVGTNSPAVRLDVRGGTLQVQQGASDSANFSIITSSTPSSGTTLRSSWSGTGSQGPMIFDLGGTERARFTSDGYLRMASGTGGIQFGGDTAAANALDDYEEGTFTPTLTFGGASAGVTYNASFNGATYTKIGNRVFVSGLLVITNKGSSTGDAAIGNLPFTSVSGQTNYLGAYIAGYGFTFADFQYARIAPNSTTIDLAEVTNAGVATSLTNADFTNSVDLYFSAHYTV